ncbi:unnamed protein product [Arctia plantaginis]|uniref:Cilia- and flagella-associated protein 157 n=1 Tax=Arctia plantaginis TaxID=874455 RepID=A0A8S0ZVF2_ARCPL|nr:unnamed protein product [Arctia plantaginis]
MAPKKDKGKKNENAVIFNQVERTLLEQEVAECNRKIARLRSSVSEYEACNEELQNALEKLDEDRADIIAFLKKQLSTKIEEYNELKEKVDGLIEIRDRETKQFHETVTELQNNFTRMKDQLTSENKLLAGKLNTLEEFRFIRDDLMQRFNAQEQKFVDQEMCYKRIIYETEKKFVIGKDKLKKEMEARLLQLAQDFQDATEIRIAASTHRVIRENIAISNELDNILNTQQKISEQNEMYKENIRAAFIAKEVAEEERDTAINKSVIQLKVIDQFTTAFEKIKKGKALCDKKIRDFEALQAKVEKLTKENDNLTLQVRILEQNLHAKLCSHNKDIVDACKISKERDKLRKILQNAAFAIQAALKLDQWAYSNPERQAMDRQLLLTNLLQIVTQFRETQRAESLATIASFSNIYNKGDLGLLPKPEPKQKTSWQSCYEYSHISQAQKLQSGRESEQSETAPSLLSSSPSGSLKTIPSMHALSIKSDNKIVISEAKPSLSSFVSSTQSTASDDEESQLSKDNKTDLEKQLLASKIEIQKSILKDLALSQLSFKRSSLSIIQNPTEATESTISIHKKLTTRIESGHNFKDLQSSEHDLSDLGKPEQEKILETTENKVLEESTDKKTEKPPELITDETKIDRPLEQSNIM